jgi:general stress protein YciG
MTNQNQSGNTDKRGSGNFANDPERASEAGRKGGQQTQGGSHDQGSGRQQGAAGQQPGQQSQGSPHKGSSQQGRDNAADDSHRANEAERKGGK